METKTLAYIHHSYSETLMLTVPIKQMYGESTSSTKHDALYHDTSKLSNTLLRAKCLNALVLLFFNSVISLISYDLSFA